MKTVKLVYRLAYSYKISKTKLVPCNYYARDRNFDYSIEH